MLVVTRTWGAGAAAEDEEDDDEEEDEVAACARGSARRATKASDVVRHVASARGWLRVRGGVCINAPESCL